MSRFTDVFIKRPVFATTIALLIFLVGLLTLSRLQIRLFPKMDSSVISISTSYPGANAQTMEGYVTNKIENSLAGIDGIDFMDSKSTQGLSHISVHMKLGTDINEAMTDITSKVHAARWQLPKDIQDPVIDKSDPNQMPIVFLSFQSNTMSRSAVTDFLDRVVQPQLQLMDGVSQATVMNQYPYAMRIWLDPELMSALGVSPTDVVNALESNNVQSAAGYTESKEQYYNIYAKTDLDSAAEFNNIPLRSSKGNIVKIKDIGHAELSTPEISASIISRGLNTIFLAVFPQSTANPLSVAKETIAMIPTIQQSLPTGLAVSLFGDFSQFISDSLKEVTHTIFESSFFVFLVIFIMIGSLRTVFIPLVTIPLSLIGGCIFMYIFNFTINTMTLLAFVLAIGLVVDDAIVVLENIHRHLANGLKPFDAAITGAREIAFAVITMTLTLAAVYAPIGFTTGLTGKLFSEFAFTLASAVIVSGFLALTLSPMMCSKLYHENENLDAGLPGKVNHFFDHLMSAYQRLLEKVINLKWIVLLFAVGILVVCIFVYMQLPQTLVPDEDQGYFMAMGFGPSTANLTYTENQMKPMGKIFDGIPEIEHYAIINGWPSGLNSSMAFALLTDFDKRKRTAMDIVNSLYMPLMAIPGMQVFPVNPPLLPGAGGNTPIDFVLKTTNSYPYLYQESQKFVDALNKWGGLRNVRNSLQIDKPQTVVDIHRNDAADLGISMNDVSTALNLFLGYPDMTRFTMQGRSYDVIPAIYKRYQRTPDAMYDLKLRSQSGKLVPLSSLATITEQVIPRELDHFQQLRSTKITANLSPGVVQGDALTYMTNLAEKMLPKDIQVDYSGQSRQYEEASGKMMQTFIFAIIFIYLILSAQFESFKDPFIVMLSVPLSIAGALMLLLVTGSSLNIYTQIGLITLVGLITKNGILIVEFANQQQEKGMELREAILTAAAIRLRPILMTTCAMILGSVPLAMASGAGAISRHQMGLVIIGGMSFGTLLTLFVVPTAYYYFASKRHAEPVED